MIFIIASNIGLALMTILVYMRYSQFRVSFGNKIRELQKTLKKEREEKAEILGKLELDYKKENEQVKSLLREVEQARKERQDEIKMRLEAEKEIEMSKEKIIQVQKRVEDWKVLQEGAINDSKDMIIKFGQDLINSVRKGQQEEELKTRQLLEKSAKFMEENVSNLHEEIGGVNSKVSDFKKRLSDMFAKQQEMIASIPTTPVQVAPVAPVQTATQASPAPAQAATQAAPAPVTTEPASAADVDVEIDENEKVETPKTVQMDEVAQKAMKDVVSLAEASGLTHMKDYIVASELDEKKAKYMLCDLFLLVDGTAYFVDFKADRYFADHDKLIKEKDEKVALEVLQKKLDKYLAYISNPKYSSLINKLIAALKITSNEFKVVFAVRGYDDMALLNKIGYSQKIEKAGIELMDVNGVNDLLL